MFALCYGQIILRKNIFFCSKSILDRVFTIMKILPKTKSMKNNISIIRFFKTDTVLSIQNSIIIVEEKSAEQKKRPMSFIFHLGNKKKFVIFLYIKCTIKISKITLILSNLNSARTTIFNIFLQYNNFVFLIYFLLAIIEHSDLRIQL